MKVLHLEDDLRDIELLKAICAHQEPDCELTPVMNRTAFLAGLKSGRYVGILSDSGVPDLFGAEAVQMARTIAPGLPFVFLCGVMGEAKRANLEAAKPDGLFSKDSAEDLARAIGTLRELSNRNHV